MGFNWGFKGLRSLRHGTCYGLSNTREIVHTFNLDILLVRLIEESRRWKDIIRVDLRAKGNEGRRCLVLALNINHWRDFRHERC